MRGELSDLLRRTASRLTSATAGKASAGETQALEKHPELARVAARRGDDPLRVTEREIAEEIAYSLGKAGRQLERAIADVRSAAQALAGLSPSDSSYPSRQARLIDARREAERRLRYLKIQREALGLRSHRDVERRYPLPEL